MKDEFNLGYIEHLPNHNLRPKNYTYYDTVKMFYARNDLIVKDSDILIAQVAEDRKGGTENTIKYFIKKYKKGEENLILL